MWELTKSFRFEAAHSLHRAVDVAASRRVHGHSYRVVVAVRGTPNANGMIIDLGVLEAGLADTRAALDHRLLDEVDGLGPATLETLCVFIWRRLGAIAGLTRVTVHRDSLDEACSYQGDLA